MSLQSVYGIRLTKDRMVTTPSLAIEEFTTTKSTIIKGDCTISGTATCASLRGASSNRPVSISSAAFVFNNGDKCWFTSPIAGRIHTMYVKPISAAIIVGVAGKFYTGDGIKATAEFGDDLIAQWYPYPVEFDWTDENDLLFCTVGVGTPFFFVVTAEGVGTTFIITAKITPLIQGGSYG